MPVLSRVEGRLLFASPLFASVFLLALTACGPRVSPEQKAKAVEAFATVEKVFQHPRCSNCHIPGDAPLQFDAQTPHAMGVVRGPEGKGALGLPCATCHAEANPPASDGPHAPPGAPHWALPPPEHKMAWIGLAIFAIDGVWRSRKLAPIVATEN